MKVRLRLRGSRGEPLSSQPVFASAARTLADGSRLTRDMGYLDEQGFLFIVDRKDDMFASGGYNIWPAQLENVIAAHPRIREVHVVGVPHKRWGETPIAVVVAGEQTPSAEEIIALTREKVGSVQGDGRRVRRRAAQVGHRQGLAPRGQRARTALSSSVTGVSAATRRSRELIRTGRS